MGNTKPQWALVDGYEKLLPSISSFFFFSLFLRANLQNRKPMPIRIQYYYVQFFANDNILLKLQFLVIRNTNELLFGGIVENSSVIIQLFQLFLRNITFFHLHVNLFAVVAQASNLPTDANADILFKVPRGKIGLEHLIDVFK